MTLVASSSRVSCCMGNVDLVKQLFDRGYTVAPAGPPRDYHEFINELSPDTSEQSIEEGRRALLAACGDPGFQILTGREAQLVAVRCKSDDIGRVAGVLGHTPAVLQCDDGTSVSAY